LPRISQLPSLPTPDGADELAIVDASASVTKKITRTDFLSGAPLPNNTVTTAAITDSSVTTAKINNDAVTATKIDWASTGANGGIWWEELGRTTLGSAGDTITVSSLPARKYLQIRFYIIASGNIDLDGIRFNGDTGANYAYSKDVGDGAANASATGQTKIEIRATATTGNFIGTLDIVNISTQPKLLTGNVYINLLASGAGAPVGVSAIWGNTADSISSISFTNNESGDYAIGSEIVVLGHN